MTISNTVREQVRQRANFACEYCGVTETNSGGGLTIDHFQPQSQGGSDDLENLIYCCHRCNEYKSDFWPRNETASSLWNPRLSSPDTHFLETEDGVLHATSAVGRFTLQWLRLNRSALITHRLQKRRRSQQEALLKHYEGVITLIQQVREQERLLVEKQQSTIEEQRRMIRILLNLR